jgi:hypothetical protein
MAELLQILFKVFTAIRPLFLKLSKLRRGSTQKIISRGTEEPIYTARLFTITTTLTKRPEKVSYTTTATQLKYDDIKFQKKELFDHMTPFSITSCILQHTPQ